MNPLPPIGWTMFAPSAPPRAVWPAIINRIVNNGIDPMQGPMPPVVDEIWRVWPRYGWCYDYAVTKRYELLLRGFAASELLLAEVALPDLTHHLVLVVAGHVLDNLTPLVRAWPQYELVRMQDKDNPDLWECKQ